MKLFAASSYYEKLLPALAGEAVETIGECETRQYPNGEIYTQLKTDVSGHDCLVVGSIAPPAEQLARLFSLGDALKRNGARLVRAFLPYLAYARQDKLVAGQSGGISLMGALLYASGVEAVITIEAHSAQSQKLIGLPVVSLSAAPLFSSAVQALVWPDATLLAPDEGAIERTKALATAVGSTRPLAHLVKTHSDGVRHLRLVGELAGNRVIIVDDVLDTGQTLISACEVLGKHGVTDIALVITHGLFTGSNWQQLFGLGVKKLFVSSSCPEAARQKHSSIEVISLEAAFNEVMQIATSEMKGPGL